jgi:hypothetical protein
MEIFDLVTMGFNMASKKRGERIPASVLDRLVFNFMGVYESLRKSFANERLRYELARYPP